MSYIKARFPQFKTHNQINHLKSALGSQMGSTPGATAPEMWAYELKDNEYQVLWHIESGTTIEHLPWAKRIYHPRPISHTPCSCSKCKS